jgi:hypothetical protein
MFLSTPEPLDRTVFTAAAPRKSRTASLKNLIREDRSFRRNQGPTTTKSGLPGYAWVVGKFIGLKHYLLTMPGLQNPCQTKAPAHPRSTAPRPEQKTRYQKALFNVGLIKIKRSALSTAQNRASAGERTFVPPVQFLEGLL